MSVRPDSSTQARVGPKIRNLVFVLIAAAFKAQTGCGGLIIGINLCWRSLLYWGKEEIIIIIYDR